MSKLLVLVFVLEYDETFFSKSFITPLDFLKKYSYSRTIFTLIGIELSNFLLENGILCFRLGNERENETLYIKNSVENLKLVKILF